MATITTTHSLKSALSLQTIAVGSGQNSTSSITRHDSEPGPDAANIAEVVPDGGYAWLVVLGCAVMTFWFTAMLGSWGVIQTALLEDSLATIPTSTITFVGSLGMGLSVGCSLLAVRVLGLLGARATALLGMSLIGLGTMASGFFSSDIGGLFGTSGVVFGLGMSLSFCISNTVPNQYFSSKLGLANGIVKLGGGLGATVSSIAFEALIRRVGTAWMFRIAGFMMLSTGLPAAWLVKERTSLRGVSFIELSMFKNLPFVAIFIATAIGTFALFVPPYFLPLFARAAGLSSSTGAGIVAAFNGCAAIGRFAAGPVCDRIGPLNTLSITMAVNALTMLAIWPISSSIGPLIVFALLNGVANGAFFTTLPTVVASIFGPGRAAVAMSTNITGWGPGYLLGTPVAGYLLQAAGAEKARSIDLYRPAVFYAGGIAFASMVFVLVARLKMEKKLIKRI
jgi:MFS transporter, MCT family, solute carrier family 16 (monocarboxylic acid transporters), member 3